MKNLQKHGTIIFWKSWQSHSYRYIKQPLRCLVLRVFFFWPLSLGVGCWSCTPPRASPYQPFLWKGPWLLVQIVCMWTLIVLHKASKNLCIDADMLSQILKVPSLVSFTSCCLLTPEPHLGPSVTAPSLKKGLVLCLFVWCEGVRVWGCEVWG